MADISSIYEACHDLDEKLSVGDQPHIDLIRSHLQKIDTKMKYAVPDFPKGLFENIFGCVHLSSREGTFLLIFFCLYENIHCGYSLEVPH